MSVVKRFCFDIETYPTRNQTVIDKIKAEESAKECPGKPDSANPRQATLDKYAAAVEAWNNDLDRRIDEKYAATAKNPLLAEPLCIAAVCDGDPISWSAMHEGMSEKDMLSQFMRFVGEYCDRSTRFFGYCIKIFDLPVIVTRCRVHGIDIPDVFPTFNRRWSGNSVDIQDLIYSPRPCLSFKDAATLHGLQAKTFTWLDTPVSGEHVKLMYDKKAYSEIVKYCNYDAMDEWRLLNILKPSSASEQVVSLQDQITEVLDAPISAELKVLTLKSLIQAS